ncbi:MAG: hypothetical protein JWP08_1479 [Bryobacterales bacterium]|nr:hypothetical protein [Bryobacterales bacterium]
MRKRFISLGCWLAGIVIVAALYLAATFTGWWWLVFVAIVLAALDARRVRIWRYRSDIARSPGTLFILMLLFGWLILPWYIGLRLKILAGTAELKDTYRWADPQASPPDHHVSKSGLIQPWRRR